jgi:hypothetical protein
MEPMELKEQTEEIAEGKEQSRFNRAVAGSVALIAVFMMLCNVKDGNIVQSMMQAQAAELDHWNHYQAKSTKQHLYNLQIEQWQLQAATANPTMTPAGQQALQAAQAHWKDEVARYDKEMRDLKEQAEGSRKEYDDLNFRDDQFDLSEALLGLAITLLAVCGLTRSKWLYVMAVVVAVGGIVMGLSGFFQWPIHPGAIIQFLT